MFDAYILLPVLKFGVTYNIYFLFYPSSLGVENTTYFQIMNELNLKTEATARSRFLRARKKATIILGNSKK